MTHVKEWPKPANADAAIEVKTSKSLATFDDPENY